MVLNNRGDEEDDVLDLGCIPTGTANRLQSACLVGKLIVEKSYNVFALIDVMSKSFKPKGKLQARDWGHGLIMFSFERADDRDWVIRN